ncbi:MAG TPA: pilus assembly protein PilM, partial [Vicinamibacterales bacterium]
TEAVQKELGLSFDAAEQLKRGVPVDGATVEDAQPVLRAVTENVVLEIQKTLEFFKATASVDHIDQVVLSGGVSRIEGLRELLEERLHAKVEYFDPFKAVKWDAAKLGGVDPALVASTAAVAVGLALRHAGDR